MEEYAKIMGSMSEHETQFAGRFSSAASNGKRQAEFAVRDVFNPVKNKRNKVSPEAELIERSRMEIQRNDSNSR